MAQTRLKLNDNAVVNPGYSVGTIGNKNANNHCQKKSLQQ